LCHYHQTGIQAQIPHERQKQKKSNTVQILHNAQAGGQCKSALHVASCLVRKRRTIVMVIRIFVIHAMVFIFSERGGFQFQLAAHADSFKQVTLA
jgi:hypothetical protein